MAGIIKRSIISKMDGPTTSQKPGGSSDMSGTGQKMSRAETKSEKKKSRKAAAKAIAAQGMTRAANAIADAGIKIAVARTGNLSMANKINQVKNTVDTAANVATAALAGGPLGIAMAVALQAVQFASETMALNAQDEIDNSSGAYKARITQTNVFRMKGR